MAKISVVGLGPGDMSSLPMGTYHQLQSGLAVYLRTAVHPVVDELRRQGIQFTSFDDLYETQQRFEDVYSEMADRLLKAAKEHGDIIYAVPGHPLMAEQSVQNLLHTAGEVEVSVGGGQSFLDAVCGTLGVDPIEGFLLLDGTQLTPSTLDARMHTFLVQVYNQQVASEVKLSLMEVYPDDYGVTVVRAAGVPTLERIERVPLHELDRLDFIDHLTTLYIPPTADPAIRRSDPWFLAELVKRLREPGGCPWDRKQTHQSLRPYVIEEAYEVAHAIGEDDPYALSDELGDLLLQVLLHAQIASESGDFMLRDVYGALADKLIRRHPHVFGDVEATSVDDANTQWRLAKASEQVGGESLSLMDQVKWARPPQLVALDLQQKAASIGFDWEDKRGVFDKVREEIEELAAEIDSGRQDATVSELGDVLFSLINLARWLEIDVNDAMSQANHKFAERFRFVEEKIKENGRDVANIGTSALEKYWNQAKRLGKTAIDSRD